MKLPEKRDDLRTTIVGLKVTEEEKKELKRLAAKHNMTVSTFIRYAVTQVEQSEAENPSVC